MNKPRAPLSAAFPAKGSATPQPDVSDPPVPGSAKAVPQPVQDARTAVAPKLNLRPKQRNEYAALTIRPGPERRKRLDRVCAETGNSMQDVLLACFDAFYPPSETD